MGMLMLVWAKGPAHRKHQDVHQVGHQRATALGGGQKWVTGFLDKQWLVIPGVCFQVLFLLCEHGTFMSLSGFPALLKEACMVIPALPNTHVSPSLPWHPPPQRDHNNLFGNSHPYPSCFPGWDPVPALWLQEMRWTDTGWSEASHSQGPLPTFDPPARSLHLRTRSTASSWASESGTGSCSTKG